MKHVGFIRLILYPDSGMKLQVFTFLQNYSFILQKYSKL